MNIIDLIIKKRDCKKLESKEISFFVNGLCNGTIPDYQASAMLMAIFLNGLDAEETAELTFCMAKSGKIFNLSDIKGIKVDKHSTGGVADTTTLILAPLVASTGVPIIKMSGKGLGFSGGTIDKLESIPGFKTELTEKEAIQLCKKSLIAIMSQSSDITPADKKLYSLRDVTGTVENISLIASSIMSKKIASGSDAIVLDVKCGSGAFMKDYESAKKLAKEMISIGKKANKNVTAVISSMEQPLGMNIGNSLEVIEAIEALKGNINGDIMTASFTLGIYMLLAAKRVSSFDEGMKLLEQNIKNGTALKKFHEFIINQGGNGKIINDYSLLPLSNKKLEVKAETEGYIYSMDTALIGKASVETGAGRESKDDIIDLGAGIVMKVRLSDYVKKGDTLAIIYSKSNEKNLLSAKYLKSAIEIKKEKPQDHKLILDIIK